MGVPSSDSRRAQVCAATMEASAVVRMDSTSSMNVAFVFVPCAASIPATMMCSGWREPECDDVWADYGIEFVNQSRSARRNGDYSVMWSR